MSPWRSIKTKVTIISLAIFFIGIWSFAYYTSFMLRNDLQQLLFNQQLSAITLVASDINQELNFRLRSLEKISERISPQTFSKTEILQKHLEDRPLLQSLFNGGYFAITADGTTIADVPRATGRIGMNVSEKGWMKEALSGKSAIGKPVIGKMLKVPVFTMATPVRNETGAIIGVLAGVVDLSKDNFLNNITANRYGKTGDFLLISRKDRVLITGSDKNRIMEVLPPAGAIPEMDRFIAGEEGSKRFINPKGVDVLVSAKGIPVADWYAAALLPTEEAFAPLKTMNQHMMLAAILLSSIVGLAVFAAMNRQLAPMLNAVKNLSAISESKLPVTTLPVTTHDEVGQLIMTFNSLLATLAQREATLQESEGKFRVLFEESPYGVLLVDPETFQVNQCNPVAHTQLGYTSEEFIGMNVGDFEAIDDFEAIRARTEQLHKEGGVVFETTHRTKSGEPRNTIVQLKLVRISGKVYVQSIHLDITENKRSSQMLELYKAAMDNAADSMFLIKRDASFSYVNRAACETLGYSKAELLDMGVKDVDPDFPIGSWDEHWRELSLQRSMSFESRHRTKDGTLIPVELGLRFFPFSGEEFHLAVARNLTERRQAEEEKKNLEKQLLHAQKLESLGVLAGGIAHDFNNILTAIIGNADLALLKIDKNSPIACNLNAIEQGAARAADLAKQMLAYSGKGKFLLEHLDLNKLFQDMLHMLEVSISKKAALRLNLMPNLPAIEADATQMRQLIMNLVINASEAIGDTSGFISVNTGCVECDRAYLQDVWLDDRLSSGLYVYFEVADTGCGMDKETISKLFDPFFTTKFTGRGLGMAAVLGIVRGHKGAIKVQSEPNKGTTFKIILPASEQPAETLKTDIHHEEWKGAGTILLVDDEGAVRDTGKAMLNELGFTVITASDGRNAVEVFKENQDIAYVLLDLTMPHMDGEQCFNELRKIKSDLKVIMSSGFNEQEITQKFFGKGLAGFIQKPYRFSVLKETLKGIAEMA